MYKTPSSICSASFGYVIVSIQQSICHYIIGAIVDIGLDISTNGDAMFHWRIKLDDTTQVIDVVERKL